MAANPPWLLMPTSSHQITCAGLGASQQSTSKNTGFLSMPALTRPKALHKQTDEFLLWYRYPPNANTGYGKRHVVHGHTPNPRGPEERSRQTNLDTLAWRTGRLVVAVFDDQRPGGATEFIELPNAGQPC